MKFIVDENLPPELCRIFNNAGLVAYHINELKSHKKQRIKDDQIRHLALFKDFIIVTKDDDFVRSYVSRKVPEKMIFIFRLDEKKELITRLQHCIGELGSLLATHDFIELNEKEIRMPFS